RLIFSTSANGSRKNSSSQAKGTPNTTRRWNTTARTRSAKGVINFPGTSDKVPDVDEGRGARSAAKETYLLGRRVCEHRATLPFAAAGALSEVPVVMASVPEQNGTGSFPGHEH